MDMEELGYFLYMNEMEKKQKATSSDLFGDSSDSEDDEEEQPLLRGESVLRQIIPLRSRCPIFENTLSISLYQ